MTKINIFIFLFLIFYFFFSSQAAYNYPYNCESTSSSTVSQCRATQFGALDIKDKTKYFINNEAIVKIDNLTKYIDNRILDYVNYYGDTQMTIQGYYTGTGGISNIKLTLSDLFSLGEFYQASEEGFFFNKKIVINNTYNDGKEYFFRNLSVVINELHKTFPVGDKVNMDGYDDILWNIVNFGKPQGYDEYMFYIKNICTISEDESCEESKYLAVNRNSTNTYYLLKGDIKRNDQFIADTFKVSNDYTISDYFLKSGGNPVTFNFGYEDALDVSKTSTEYEYLISYKYEGDETIVDYLKETIVIGQDFKISSNTIKPEILNDIVELTVLNSKSKKIRLGIKESLNLTKPGKIIFYLTAKNLNTGDEFPRTPINVTPVQVLPSDDVRSGDALITTEFNKILNDAGFNVGDTFSVTLSLKDLFGNQHYDFISSGGYEISLSSGTSDKIEISKAGSNEYAKVLTGVTTTTNSPYYVSFKFRVISSGYHQFNGFNLKVRSKRNDSVYEPTPKYYYVNNIIPTNLYNGPQLMKIHIKSQAISDFNLTCSKGPITIKTKCESDNFSGCNPSMNREVIFTEQSQNGSTGTLSIQDYAYNTKNYNYTMNHIDQTAPSITLMKGAFTLTGSSYNYKANDDEFKIRFYEWTTANCSSKIHYLIKLNGVDIFNSSVNQSYFEITIPNILTQAKTGKVLYVKSTDNYGNSSEKTLNLNIYPADLEQTKTLLTLVDEIGTKYANNFQKYTYNLYLKDKYENPIYNKFIDTIEHSIVSYTLGKTILSDMTDISNPSGDPVFITDGYIGAKTDSTGKITFKLKSLAPGDFTQRFFVKMNKWDDAYTDFSTLTQQIYAFSSQQNSFKKPFVGKIFVSNDNGVSYSDVPDIGTVQKYKIELILKSGNISPFSNGLINISENTIKNSVMGHFWKNFGNIANDFSSDYTKYLGFTSAIDTNNNITVLKAPIITTNNLNISYIIGGKNISYRLSSSDTASSFEAIDIGVSNDKKNLGLKVIGNIQGSDKSNITGQKENVSDLSKSELRTQIRKNAFEYVKNMKNGQIMNGIKYIVDNDVILNSESSISGIETLVVNNGNVIIGTGILNITNKKFGVIVLKDKYNVGVDFNTKGNVYIKNNVKTINAIIYADGGIISANSAGVPYTNDNEIRTSELQNQLVLNGTLFTRNTIGGALFGSANKYTLPGGSITSNYDIAMLYDLNYIRRGNKNPQSGYSESFIIKYDPKIQLNPPKLFK